MSSAPVLLVELYIDAAWVDVTSDVYEGTVSITRGRSDADSQAAPQSMHLTFKNDAGKYSPRNPLSPYFGKIGRNTRIRATVSTSSRFYGEVAAWEPTWDETHRIKTVPIVANGITRRMGQGSAPASVALRDYLLSLTQKPSTYYPLSGASGTTYSLNVGEQFPGVRFYSTSGITYAYGTELADWLGTGLALSTTGATGYLEGQSGVSAANIAVDFVFQSSHLGVLDLRLFITPDSYWNLRLNTAADAGTMVMTYYDDANGLITDAAGTSPIQPALSDGAIHTVRFQLSSVAGPSIESRVYIDGNLIMAGGNGITPQSVSGLYLFRMFYSVTGSQAPVTLAHVAAWAEANTSDIPAASSIYQAAVAYAGEKAADRITRIAALAGTTATIVGTAAKTVAMGPQVAETRLSQLRDAEATDFGILCESRSSFALRYRTRESMYNQSAVAVIDYAALQMAVPFQPVDDDQQTRNDVTASRRGGDDYRIVKTTGPLSIQDPPNGVGPYQDSITVNVQTDAQLAGEAAWWLNLGTLDDARFPQVTLNLAATAIDNTKATAIRALDVGDLLQVVNLTGTDIYSDVSLIVLGYTETISDLQHVITFNCAAAAPYTVGKYSDVTRYDTAGSELAASATSTATTLSVNNTGSTIWTRTVTGLLYLNVGGEKIRVTAISGTSNPQTFTVVRSQNAVVKAHASGTKVRLWDTPRYAL